jgi:hypothetical protein
MALYYPQVTALVQGMAANAPEPPGGWDLFPNSSNTISSLDTWNYSMTLSYGTDGIQFGTKGTNQGTGHCGMATTGSAYVVDLTKDFSFYFVLANHSGSSNLNDATMCGFYNAPLGSTLGGNYPAAPIPKNTNNFGITIAGWYMRGRYGTHKLFVRNSSTDTAFPAFASAQDPTDIGNGTTYPQRRSATYSQNWDLNVYKYTASTGIIEYHLHQYSTNGQSTWAGTTSQGTPITDYYLTGSHLYNFSLGSGGWNTPSSINLTSAHLFISAMNSSSDGTRRTIPRFGLIQ